MDNVKHTPGPWMFHPDYKNNECTIVRPEDGGKPWISRDVAIASGEKTVAHANFWTAEGGFPRVDNEAEMLVNARLIAAAPELLDVLETLTGFAEPDGHLPDNIYVRKAVAAANEVISKATGGA